MSEYQQIIGDRLKAFRKARKLNLVPFSDLLGITHSSLSALENNKSKPSAETIENICRNTDINIYWLLTGEGEMTRSEAKKGGDSLSILYKEGDDEDPEVADLLVMTRAVVNSKTEYAESLKANIRSFHHSVVLEERISRLENQMVKLSEARPAALSDLEAENERLKHQNRLLEGRLTALGKKLSSQPGHPEKVSVNE